MEHQSLATNKTDKALALSGIFQSAALVQQLSRTGELPNQYLEASLESIFSLNPSNIVDVYGSEAKLELGIETLYKVLANNDTARYSDAIRYSIGILHVEKMLRKNNDLLSVLRSRLEAAESQLIHFDGVTNASVIAKLADIYVDTIGSLRYRIQVKGDPQQLQRDNVANQIRAILLSGVRSAMLWRQLGGSRIQLLIGKKSLVTSLESLKSSIHLENDQ
ncbi:MAG: high frequency lysogenization protein HflD [Pseudomonadales bacterium]|nr:high frequency lysogenization protein HflD [Pseudomonadales bacterium]